MRSLFLFFFLLILFACKTRSDKSAATRSAMTAAKDSNTVLDPAEDSGTVKFVKLGHLDLRDYYIELRSKMRFPPGYKGEPYEAGEYFKGNFLYCRNKKTGRADSLKLDDVSMETGGDLRMVELSDSLHMKGPLFEITWQGDSDIYTSDFIEGDGDSLKELFALSSLVSIKRQDQWTLAGFYTDRDELVANFEPDYPFTVSLKDFLVSYTQPAKQAIDYGTTTTGIIKGWRIFKRSGGGANGSGSGFGSTDSSAYAIRKGVRLRVDTIYRDEKFVQLRIRDSIIVHVPLDSVDGKLKGNGAG